MIQSSIARRVYNTEMFQERISAAFGGAIGGVIGRGANRRSEYEVLMSILERETDDILNSILLDMPGKEKLIKKRNEEVF